MKRPRIGVFKFTSCDGCQLSVLNMEDELPDFVNLFQVAYFREATDKPLRGHFDIALVEGSISTDRQRRQAVEVRERTRYLVTIGACATAGGLQALRNWASIEDYKKFVYPSPGMIETLPCSTPISDHVYVDYELWGCPVNSDELSETLGSFLLDRRPGIPAYSLCMECKRKGIPCLLVAKFEPCLGPVTRAGCGVLCPSLERPCYGCFGPKESANIESLLDVFRKAGLSQHECALLLDKMNTYAFRKARTGEGRL
jgi:coenzyme F420-reducing hydrogenase gamma subunit